MFAPADRGLGYIRLKGISFQHGADPFPMPQSGMVAANLNFRRQLKYPGTVEVLANTTQVGERSFTLAYQLFDLGVLGFVVFFGQQSRAVDKGLGWSMTIPLVLLAILALFGGLLQIPLDSVFPDLFSPEQDSTLVSVITVAAPFLGLFIAVLFYLTGTLSAQHFANYNWGLGPQDPNGYLLQRYLLSADVHYRDIFRVFGQFMSALEDGRIGGPRPIDEDVSDLHQGFLGATRDVLRLATAGVGPRVAQHPAEF